MPQMLSVLKPDAIKVKLFAACSLFLLLSACGGSGDSSDDNASPSPGIKVTDDFQPGLASRPVNQDCLAEEFLQPESGIQLERVFSSLSTNAPVAMRPLPGDSDRWMLAEQGGRILSFSSAGNSQVVADLSNIILSGGERGLLGLAIHPDYPQVPRLFVSYTEENRGDSVVASYLLDTSTLVLDLQSEQIVLTQTQPYSNHNGGNIDFGPDDMLYFGLGDGGSGGDPQNNAQNRSNWLGTLLRVDVGDASSPGYTIPTDNPFADKQCDIDGVCPEIWAWGLRNPWRWSFDRDNGQLWAGDVGQNAWEEVSLITKGKNYGWRCYEGDEPYNTNGCGAASDYVFPEATYPRTEGRSVTGGYVYRGQAISGLTGTYLFADFATGHIWGIPPGGTASKLIQSTGLNIASFAQSHAGELYVLDHNGAIYKIIAGSNSSGGTEPPARLSDVDCFTIATPDNPSTSLIPYDVNAPFWSDAASKQRWFALPENSQITMQLDGDWSFPVGSVVVKNFSLGNQLVETRFLVRHTSGDWQGYSYAWNDSLSDAELLTSPEVRNINGQDWEYPAGQCFQCHTQAAGVILGLENAQLNKDYHYSSTGITSNQLGTLSEIGVLITDQVVQLDDIDSLADPADASVSPGARARAYLHSNCSGCHRPQSTGRSNLDLRYQTAFDDMQLCAEPAQFGSAGSSSGLLLEPGDAADSVLIKRISSSNPQLRMPPAGSSIVDSEAVSLLSDWINSMPQCGS